MLAPTDVVARVTHAAICGSDLWFYRGQEDYQPGWRTGHEWLGVVAEVGSEVHSVRVGDAVLAPFAFSDGTCEFCRRGIQTSCPQGGYWGRDNDGGQGQAVRVPHADGTLVRLPGGITDELLRRALPVCDVLATGYHAASRAGVGPGRTAVIVGDGAVGLCAVLAARQLGAERVLVIGHQPRRMSLATRLGADEVIDGRADSAVADVIDKTSGGAPCVLECVGAASAMSTAINVVRPGGTVGYVGVPHGSEHGINLESLFLRNVALRGGVCPARAYTDTLLPDALSGNLDATPIFDREVSLAGIADGYRLMDAREAIKVLVRI